MPGRLISTLAGMLLAGVVLLPVPPAQAAARVTVGNGSGQASVDSTYATTLTVRGSGFQAVQGGHGGIYVMFGTVRDGWRPSQGGRTGADYLYVPDTESADAQGFQRYVAFPGSDTGDSANGGTMTRAGGWSTTLIVPGATFQAYDREGKVQTVDCRKVTCGVITIGAHGVSNARNETFTPVRVAATSASTPPSASPTATSSTSGGAVVSPPPGDGAATPAPGAPGASAPPGAAPAGPATLEVDRASAVAGNVLAFTGAGLEPGRQVTVVFDDGAAAAGPFLVGSDGRFAGVLALPADTSPGTHELRVFGVDTAPAVSFAVVASADVDERAATADGPADDGDRRPALVFVAASALALLLAAGQLVWRIRRARRAA